MIVFADVSFITLTCWCELHQSGSVTVMKPFTSSLSAGRLEALTDGLTLYSSSVSWGWFSALLCLFSDDTRSSGISAASFSSSEVHTFLYCAPLVPSLDLSEGKWAVLSWTLLLVRSEDSSSLNRPGSADCPTCQSTEEQVQMVHRCQREVWAGAEPPLRIFWLCFCTVGRSGHMAVIFIQANTRK